MPLARSVASASSATERSLVPAVTTTTRAVEALGRLAPEQAAAQLDHVVVDGTAGGALLGGRAGEQHRTGAVRQQLRHDPGAVVRLLARPVDRLGHALAQVAVMVDRGAVDVGERQAAQAIDGGVGRSTVPDAHRRRAVAASPRPPIHRAM